MQPLLNQLQCLYNGNVCPQAADTTGSGTPAPGTPIVVTAAGSNTAAVVPAPQDPITATVMQNWPSIACTLFATACPGSTEEILNMLNTPDASAAAQSAGAPTYNVNGITLIDATAIATMAAADGATGPMRDLRTPADAPPKGVLFCTEGNNMVDCPAGAAAGGAGQPSFIAPPQPAPPPAAPAASTPFVPPTWSPQPSSAQGMVPVEQYGSIVMMPAENTVKIGDTYITKEDAAEMQKEGTQFQAVDGKTNQTVTLFGTNNSLLCNVRVAIGFSCQ
jgi:hypothetical protein